jgi:hypothetical protein
VWVVTGGGGVEGNSSVSFGAIPCASNRGRRLLGNQPGLQLSQIKKARPKYDTSLADKLKLSVAENENPKRANS